MLGEWPQIWRNLLVLALLFCVQCGVYWYAAYKAGQLERCEQDIEELMAHTVMGALEGK